MNTAVIYYGGFLSKSGGAFFHANNLANELKRLGWAVQVIALDSLPILFRYLPHLAAKIVNFFHAPSGFLFKAYLTKKLYQLFFSHKVSLRVFEDIYLSWNSSTTSITVLHAVWSDNLQAFSISQKRQKKFRKSEINLINQIAHPLVTVSNPYCKYIEEEHFNRNLTKKLGVVELGIDQSKFDRLGGAVRAKKSIVYCGALEARKNVSFLLDVYLKLYSSDSRYKLTIIGDGPERNKLEKFTKEHKLPVRFLGRLSNEEALAELHIHEIYVHTSVKESFSYSLLEAKMAGLVTCASAELQIPSEFIDIGFESFCVEDWCESIINIESNHNMFDGSKFTSENMTQATLALVKI
jgi:glycosyltransferase involved in cell wall biosynthesis